MNRVLEYVITAKDATAKAISSAKSGIAGFTKNVAANLANVQAGFQMLAGTVSTVASVIKTFVTTAFKFERVEAEFKTLLNSVDKAKEHVADLRKMGAETPLQFEDLARASKLLHSFGSTTEEVMPAMKMLGDIAMGDAQKFQGLALVFAQVKSQGKLMGNDLLQFVNQGFNPLKEIADATGKSMAELKEEMGEGRITFDMVAEAMERATEEGGKFNNAMENSSKTGEGMVSTLQDNWTLAVSQFGEAFADVAKGGIGYLSEMLEKLVTDGTIETWAKKAKGWLDDMATAAKAVGDAFVWIWEKTGLSDIYHAGTGLVKGTVGGVTRTVAGLANGEGWSALKNGAIEANEQAAREMQNGYWTKKLSKGGYLGEEMKRVADDIDHENAAEEEEKAQIAARKKAEEDAAKARREAMAEEARKRREAALEEAEQKRLAAEEEKARKAEEEEWAKHVKECEEWIKEEERLRIAAEKEIARERKNQLDKAAKEQADLLARSQAEEGNAQSRLAAAQERVRQAWGWYRDKDSMRAQIEEEKAQKEAEKQFEKDFDKLRSRRRDWRTAENLSVDDEAVRRLALAKEEEKAATKYLADIEENTRALAEAVEAMQAAMEEEA